MKFSFSILLFLAITIVPQKTFSQNADKVIIKFAPLDLLDPFGQNIHLGSEFISKGRFSLETDLAVYARVFGDDHSYRIKDRLGFKIKPEVRYYLNSGKQKSVSYRGFYIADELYFIFDKFKRGDTFIKNFASDSSFKYHDYEQIRRFVLGNNFKIGYQSVTKIKLTFDYYFGLGLKYYNGSYDHEITDPICCQVMRLFEVPVYKGIKPDLTFGIKLGYVL